MVDASADRTAPVAARPSGGARRTVALLVLSCCVLIPVMDLTMVSVALTAIHQDLHATTAQLQWIMGGYVLATASAMLTVPAIGDRLGHRRILLAGLTVFGAASAAGFLAPDAGLLVATRVLMGIGAAVVLPMSMSIIVQLFREHELQRALGIAVAVVSFANPLGPVVSGVLIDRLSWDWVFMINVVMVVVVVPLSPWLLPESRGANPSRVDVPSVVLMAVGTTVTMDGVIRAGTGWTNRAALLWIAAGLVVLAGFVARQRSAAAPLMPPVLFRTPRYLWAQGMLVVASFAWYGALFLVPIYLQQILGRSALEVGVRLVPCGLLGLVATRIGERLARRFDARWIVACGLVVLAAALLAMSRATVHHGAGLVTVAMAFVSLGGTVPQASALATATRTLPAGYAAASAAFINAFRHLGGGFGVAVAGSVAAAAYLARLPAGASRSVRASIAGLGGDPRYAAAFTHGMRLAVVGMAVAVLAVAVLAVAAPRGATD